MLNSYVLLMSMQAEADPVIASLGLQASSADWLKPYPSRYYQAAYEKYQLHLLVAGKDTRFGEVGVDRIGPVGAALLAERACLELSPDILINAGTAGGYSEQGAKIGDVYLSSQTICYHDRHIQLPDFDAYGIGSFSVTNTDEIASKIGVKTGVVSTGSSLEMTALDAKQLLENQASAKEMEAAAIAEVAMYHQVPMIAVKSITDILEKTPDNSDTHTADQFIENFSKATKALADTLPKLIKTLNTTHNS